MNFYQLCFGVGYSKVSANRSFAKPVRSEYNKQMENKIKQKNKCE
ncbi:hypothetical protein SAMN04488541_102850 [Thermoflexibacter ruber]|uniref:Uncharacterized protein n=1 Tax=Thermoflexibacter ruber TaxID=1003 RepID=A0A1I2I6H1_9BACT|nr:hypothetical protein SAMN04488541_102850 [Thermoflexibacter ruber]